MRCTSYRYVITTHHRRYGQWEQCLGEEGVAHECVFRERPDPFDPVPFCTQNADNDDTVDTSD